ncbi:MAG TPA: hypothetical protein VIF38_03275 [Burkholderiales bacterium]|jgi:hypothetical protein
MSNAELKGRLYLACLAILAAGLLAGFLIYQAAEDEPEAGVTYIVVDGTAYPVAPSSSKRYLRSLEQFGGKGSVLFDEFGRWFEGLWHGKKLGITVGCLSALASLGIFLFAGYALPDRD